MKLPIILIVLAASIATSPLRAFDNSIPAEGLPSASDYSARVLPELEGTVSWRTLGQVEPVPVNGKLVPKFSDAILRLDKAEVRIYGFIIPLDLGADQSHFLISAVPPHCPFCMPAGPDAIVEVVSRKPVPYGFEPVIVSGKFAVLKDDLTGLLYRLTDAQPIAVSTQGKP